MSWEKVKLEDLYDVHNGLSKGGKFFGSGYPFITFSTVFNNFFLPDEITDYVQSTEKEQASYSVLRGDVFVTRTSETSDELGMSCVALKDYPRATYNGFTKRMRPKDNSRVYPEYIGYYMRMPSFRAEFQAFSTMTTRASLRNEDLLSLYINLPPYQEQVRIAETLRNYDLLIKNNLKQIKLLEEAAQRLYKEWFVDLRFPGHETTPITDGIPEGWKCEAIDDVYSIKYGKTLPTTKINTTDKYPVYGASKVLGYYSEKNCENYAILITSRGNAGVVHRTHHKESFVTNNSFIVMTQNEKLHNAFIYFQMQQLNFKSIVTGACQQQLTNNLISQKKVVIPSTSILETFNAIADPLFERIEAIIAQNSNLAEARDRLLPKLMNGEIEV